MASFREFILEECILEKVWIKEMVEELSSLFLIYCPREITQYTWNIRIETNYTLMAVVLNSTTVIRKGTEVKIAEMGRNIPKMTKFII